jgi:hypothetical protein
MHNTFKNQRKIQFGQKTPNKPRDNGCPNYVKESNQHKIDFKDLSHYKKLIKPKHKGMR